jgi:hypothetical protein
MGDITYIGLDVHKANCVRGSRREPEAVVSHNGSRSSRTPQILCKMAATWRFLALDCGLDRRCHERRHRGNPLTFDCRDRELWLVFRRHQLLPGAPMNPWRSIDGYTGQCWP